MRRFQKRRQRRGLAIILVVLCIVVISTMSALVIDMGYIGNARAELQRSADAAALAACWTMGEEFATGQSTSNVFSSVRTTAVSTAGSNDICNDFPTVSTSDVVIGYLGDFDSATETMDTSSAVDANAVEVTVNRNASLNGQVRTFFAQAIGVRGVDAQASATAVIIRSILGFETPGDGSNLDILPFALDLDTWNALKAGTGTDNYGWNSSGKYVYGGTDNVLEVNLYPQGTGSPGNRGTVDIGGSNNSTSDIARQIVHGISPADLADLGKPLVLDDSTYELTLNGDTGISAGVKDELASIIGQTRCIPIFSEVNGPGNNAIFTIVEWAGVRIMGVKLTGPMKKKHLTVQPCAISMSGVVPSVAGSGSSSYVYSRAFLIR